MRTPYNEWAYKGSHPIGKVAEELFRTRRTPCRLAPLVLMTDPNRLPDPVAAVQNLPQRSAVIYRHFGRKDARAIAETLRQITFKRDQQLLIGDDPQLATEIGADGVHFKRDRRLTAPTLWRQLCPDWIISMAGIKHGAYEGDLSVLDALIVSSVFESKSPSAGAPIGIDGFTAKVRTLQDAGPGIFALGGINANTAERLSGSGAAGIAGISGILERTANMTDVSIKKTLKGDDVQFVARLDGHDDIGVLDLKQKEDNVFVATHTGVPRSMGGKGVGSALVKAMIKDARQSGYKIVPACSFVEAQFKRHKEWADLRA